MSKRDTGSVPYVTPQGRVNPTSRDIRSLRFVLEFDFKPALAICGNCNRPIGARELFRTIAPSNTRYHAGCVSKRAIGSNASDSGLGQTRLDRRGKPIR